MKKFIAAMLCIVIAVSLMPVYSNAANSGSITVSPATVVKGETAAVTVSLADCDAVWGVLLYIVYDNSLTASDFANGNVFADTEITAPSLNMTYNPENLSGALFDRLKIDMTGKKYFCYYAENSTFTSNNEISSGTLFSIKFNTSAASGTYTIDCIYDPAGGIVSTDGYKTFIVNPTVVAGTLTVKEPRMIGDVNGDGKINALDLLGLKLHMSGKKIITDSAALTATDLTKDGKINALDLLRIKLFMSGKLTSL